MSAPALPDQPGITLTGQEALPTLRIVMCAVIVTALTPVVLLCAFLWVAAPVPESGWFVAMGLGCVAAGGALAFVVADRYVLRGMRGLEEAMLDGAASRDEAMDNGFLRPSEVERIEATLRRLARTVAEHEVSLRNAGMQKDTLVREVHHRVKNSMQIVTSLLSLHASRIEDASAAAAFAGAHARINALAAIHREIYAAENLESIDLAQFLTNLFALSVPGPGRSRARPALDPGEGEETIPPHMAVPLGMLVLELVSMGARGEGNDVSQRTRVAFHRPDADMLALGITYEGFQMQWEPPTGKRSDLAQMLASAYVQQLHATLEIDATPAGSSLALHIPFSRPLPSSPVEGTEVAS